MGKDAEMDEILDKITVEQDGISYLVEIKGIEYAHFEVEHIYAVVNYYTGYVIYNLDFDNKYEKKYILTTT